MDIEEDISLFEQPPVIEPPKQEVKPATFVIDSVLTKEQEAKIINLWNSRKDNPPSIRELVIEAFGELTELELDGRSRYSKSVKTFLTERQTKLEEELKNKTKDKPFLTEEQKEFVAANCKTMKVIEMTNIIFKKECSFGSGEVRLVLDYIKNELGSQATNNNENSKGDYEPPTTIRKAAFRVNKYILNAINVDDIDNNPKLQTCMKSLIRFCHMYRYIMLINNYKNPKNKELFEQSYIRFIWDKPDLSEIELDLVCNVCCDIVALTDMQGELEDLKAYKSACADDSEGRKISMSLVEDIKNLRKEMDDNQKRQSAAWKNLEGTRNDRIKNRVLENASLIQLIEAWKNEDKRNQLIQLAEVRKSKLKDEIQRIKSLDDLHIQIWGLDEGVINS